MTFAATTATDDFSSGTLSGGSNWASVWTGGTVDNSTQLNSSALFHYSTPAQTITRDFAPPVANTFPFTVSFDLAVLINQGSGNYGFRVHMESQQNSVFSMAWKNDLEGGALTFYYGNNETVKTTTPDWNIALGLNTIQANTYNFRIDITPVAGQNPGQWRGNYEATVTRSSDNATISTGSRAWNVGQNSIPADSFDQISFFNSSNRTVVQYDNVLVGTIPEPTIPALGALSMLLGLRRRRA